MSTTTTTTSDPKPEYHEVIIIGAGVSGMGMACQLQRKFGIKDFRILERNQSLGGTWLVNTYPGCGCDVPAPMYSYSFRQKADWSSFFPKQQELKEYFETVAAEQNLGPKFHFRTEVKEARYDTATGLWHTWTEDNSGGKRHHYVSKLLISAVGGLSQPNECTIDGHETFKGAIFHSARWDHSVQTKGKDVVVVGNGCSATQFMPIIAQDAKTVTQFVRSKHWYAPVPKNPLEKLPGWQWIVSHVAPIMWLQRFLIYCILESHFVITFLNPLGNLFRNHWARSCRAHVKKLAPKEYHDALIPREDEVMVGCKRRVIDETYLPSLKLPHVSLERSKLVKIEPEHVVTADGRRIHADVIVMANGFNLRGFGYPMKIVGSEGYTMQEHWQKFGQGGPMAYRSSLISRFPNLGVLVGPNSATGHMSLIFTSECQILYLLEISKPILFSPRPSQAAIEHLPDQRSSSSSSSSTFEPVPSFEVKRSAEMEELNWVVKAMQKLVFTTGCGSWYVDATSGRVTTLYPDWQFMFLIRSLFPAWNDLQYKHLPNGQSRPNTIPWWKRLGDRLGLGHVPHVKPEDVPKLKAKGQEI